MTKNIHTICVAFTTIPLALGIYVFYYNCKSVLGSRSIWCLFKTNTKTPIAVLRHAIAY